MKKITLFLLLFSALSVSAQLRERFPFDASGKIVYSSVIEDEGQSKDELYLKTKYFFVNTFKSANNVIQMDDKEAGILIGKGSQRIMVDLKKVSVPVDVLFTIQIEIKDGKYQYKIYDITFDNSAGEFASEEMFSKENEKEYLKAKKEARAIVDQYRDKMISVTDNLVSKLEIIKNIELIEK